MIYAVNNMSYVETKDLYSQRYDLWRNQYSFQYDL